LCGYSIANYDNNQSVSQNKIEQGNSSKNGERQLPSGSNEMGQGQNPHSDNEAQTPQGQPSNSKLDEQLNDTGTQKQNINNIGTNTNDKYGIPLVVYSVIFFSLAIGAYFIFKYKDIKINLKNKKIIILTIFCVGLLLRISFGALVEGHSMDLNAFKTWATQAANSFSEFYSSASSSDYPPFYIYILYLIGKIASIPALSQYYTLLLKIPSILADIASAYVIYKLAKKYLSLEISIMLSAFYIFNPAIFINSTFWGQVDSFFTLIIILSVYFMAENKIGLATGFFTVAVLMKPQGIIYLPLLLFEVVRKRELKVLLKMGLISLGVGLVIILPFSLHQDPLWIINLYSRTISEYPYASVNGYNFFTLIGANYVKDTSTLFVLSYHSWGMIFIVLTTLFSWFIYIKGNNTKFAPVVALIQIAGVFTFSVGMHERYLFPAAALVILSFIYHKDKRLILLAIGYSITSYINTHVILFGINNNSITIITSLLNVILFGYLVKILWDIVIKKRVYTF
ncbi:MAG TPA: hypothetical protein VIK26_09720, partial [Clostridium sp.]